MQCTPAEGCCANKRGWATSYCGSHGARGKSQAWCFAKQGGCDGSTQPLLFNQRGRPYIECTQVTLPPAAAGCCREQPGWAATFCGRHNAGSQQSKCIAKDSGCAAGAEQIALPANWKGQPRVYLPCTPPQGCCADRNGFVQSFCGQHGSKNLPANTNWCFAKTTRCSVTQAVQFNSVGRAYIQGC